MPGASPGAAAGGNGGGAASAAQPWASPGHHAGIASCGRTVIGTGRDGGSVGQGIGRGSWAQVFAL